MLLRIQWNVWDKKRKLYLVGNFYTPLYKLGVQRVKGISIVLQIKNIKQTIVTFNKT